VNQVIPPTSTNPDEKFQVVLKGLHSSFIQEEAKLKLATLFKATVEQMDKILSTPNFVVKKAISFDIASKYKSAIELAGGVCEVKSENISAFTLDVDLPSLKGHEEEPKMTTPPQGVQDKSMQKDRQETEPSILNLDVSDSWKNKFALIEKAGGVRLQKFNELTSGERMVIFNVLGALFCFMYYLAKGMWKKAIVLTSISIVLIFIIDAILESMDMGNSKITYFVSPAIFATRANIDYYKKMVLGDNGWW